MSEKEYIKTIRISELSQNKGTCHRVDDENEIALFLIGDAVYAVDNVCPHNHIPEIYKGDVDNGNVTCPVHGYTFSLATGLQPKGTGCRLRTFETKLKDGWIYVEKPAAGKFDFKWQENE